MIYIDIPDMSNLERSPMIAIQTPWLCHQPTWKKPNCKLSRRHQQSAHLMIQLASIHKSYRNLRVSPLMSTPQEIRPWRGWYWEGTLKFPWKKQTHEKNRHIQICCLCLLHSQRWLWLPNISLQLYPCCIRVLGWPGLFPIRHQKRHRYNLRQ